MAENIIYDTAYFVAQGKLGGLKAQGKRTVKQQKRIARKAAKARWNAAKTVVAAALEG